MYLAVKINLLEVKNMLESVKNRDVIEKLKAEECLSCKTDLVNVLVNIN